MRTHIEAALPSQYLTFVVGDEEYGVGIQRAKEIIAFDTLTTVPGAPAWVRGVVNLRGAVVPVVDLAIKLGQPAREITGRSCIVVVELPSVDDGVVMGILADRVSQVAELPPDAIEPAPSFGTGMRTDWLLGLGRSDKRFILLLDLDRVLAGDDADAITATAEAGAA